MKKNHQKIVVPVYVDGRRMTVEDVACLELSPSKITWSKGYVSRKSRLSDLGIMYNKQLKQFFYYFPSWRSTYFCHRIAYSREIFENFFTIEIREYSVSLKLKT